MFYKCVAITFFNINLLGILLSQKNDFKWLCGYAGGKGDPEFGISVLKFDSGDCIIEFEPDIKMYLLNTNTVICDGEGNLMIYSNGEDINNYFHELISGANNLYKFSEDKGGIPIDNGALILNKPGRVDEYIILYPVDSAFDLSPFGRVNTIALQYATIRINKLVPRGEIVNRDKDLLRDTIWGTGLNACKHANGRDWWLLIGEQAPATGIYKCLITPDTIEIIDKQFFPNYFIDGVSQSCFSPNGEYYVRYTQFSTTTGGFINLYKFDRCTGNLESLQEIHFYYSGLYGGACFSPDSKKLYIGHSSKLYQLKLSDSLPWESKILIDSIEKIPAFGMSYSFFNNGPDGKIYIGTGGTQKCLHIINKPNLSGDSCELITCGMPLQNYNISTPTFPHYRLGPIDGSFCDSLGIDNIPLCHWRYEKDSLERLQFNFLDLSGFETDQWCWDFDDPDSGLKNTSMNKNPTHLFSRNGTYNVCLISKNKNGMDTLCRNVKAGNGVSVDDVNSLIEINFWPNPGKSIIKVNIFDHNPTNKILYIYDLLGRIVKTKTLIFGSNEINIENLSSGNYIVKINGNGIQLKTEKLIKF